MSADARRRSLRLFLIGGLVVTLGLAFFVSPFASTSPDGLNKVSIDKGFDDAQRDSAVAGSPLAGYGVEGVEDERLSKGLSGAIGVVITFGIGLILFGVLVRVRAGEKEGAPGGAPPAPSAGSA
jgi:PDGLE domain